VSITLATHPSPVRVPAVYAERMIWNLVDNARRFATSSVAVSVGAARRSGETTRSATPAGPEMDDFVEVWVADDGPGVPEQERARIFERFVRLDEARNRGEGGFGLGLAIVADLSRFYGGSIRVEPGGPGAVFVLSLPAAPAPRPNPATAAADTGGATPASDTHEPTPGPDTHEPTPGPDTHGATAPARSR
jgi:signal transduction histidine kinase